MGDETTDKVLENLEDLYDFIYQHFDLYRILLLGAAGSSRADFVHRLVEEEIRQSGNYLTKLTKDQEGPLLVDKSLIHTLAEGYINAVLEPVRHNRSRLEASKHIKALIGFYLWGWQGLMKEVLPA